MINIKKGIKITLITIGIILLLIITLVTIMVIKDFKVENKINREVEEIQNIMEATDFDEELFKKKINNTVSTGDYYKVERAYKNYLRDYLKSLNDINEFYDTHLKIDNLLSAENIKKDGKDFIATKIQLNNNKKDIEKLAYNFNSMKEEEKVLSYLDKNLDDYYIDYYKKIVGNIEQTTVEKELSQELYNSSKLVDNIYNIFEFLSDNKNHWTFEDDMIYFDNDDLVNKYKSMLENITNFEENSHDEKTNIDGA